MAGLLVATKLYVPGLRPGSVRRPRLSERLKSRAGSRLALISAPAGFGKSTLLADWLSQASASGRRVAWLSLDQSDNEPRAFWSNVAAALVRGVDVAGAVLSSLQAGEPPDNGVIGALLNELGGTPDGVDIVLDDYHAIERPEIHAGVAFLLDHLPPNARLVISTRVDPALPLPRLRARGELVEIRSSDLRFTPDEAAAYLNDTMDLGLTQGNVADLGDRTEGWIAALQLAALSLHGRADATDFIASFTGNDRYVFDYLVEEVLQRQPAGLRQFLLRTSFLERLSGPLCNAVLETGGSGAILDTLHRRNLFLVPLDDRRQWYRYHHLFAEVLQAHLVEEFRADLPLLNRRASAWYEQQGEPAAAIRHALAGEDFERAAALITRAIPELQRTRQEAALRDALRALPDALVRSQPVLGIGLVGAMLSSGQPDDIAGRLRDAESALQAMKPPVGEGVSDRALALLPCQIETYHAALAQMGGDMPAMIAHAQRAGELALDDDYLGQGAAAALLGIAFWTRGELAAAERSWRNGLTGIVKAGHIGDAHRAVDGPGPVPDGRDGHAAGASSGRTPGG